MNHNIYASILVMFLTIYAVRALPLTLIRKEIKNPFIQSFLYYVPYVSLSIGACVVVYIAEMILH